MSKVRILFGFAVLILLITLALAAAGCGGSGENPCNMGDEKEAASLQDQVGEGDVKESSSQEEGAEHPTEHPG